MTRSCRARTGCGSSAFISNGACAAEPGGRCGGGKSTRRRGNRRRGARPVQAVERGWRKQSNIMRICIYTHTALPLVGGQEMVIDALAREFTRMGHDLVVLAPRPTRFARLGDEDLPYRVARHPRFISKHLVGWYRWWL